MYLTGCLDMAELDRISKAEDAVPSALGYKLARFDIRDRLTGKPGQLLNDVGKLQKVLPAGSGLWAVRSQWSTTMSDWVCWDVLIACPHALTKEEWMDYRLEEMKVLQMNDNQEESGLEVASSSEKLLMWDYELNHIGNYKLGSLQEVKRVWNAA
jgi:hypothetical protein